MKNGLLTIFLIIALMPVNAQGNLTDMDFKVFRLGFLLGTKYYGPEAGAFGAGAGW